MVGGATAETPKAEAVVLSALVKVVVTVARLADWRDDAASEGETDEKGATGAAEGSTGAETPVAALKVISKIKLNVARLFVVETIRTTIVIREASKLRS